MRSLSRVVVIGAGPAGCAAALTLAQNGILPLLVEKGLPGKDKACGDAWVPSAVEELRSFGIGQRELGANWHSFPRIDGYYADRRVWSAGSRHMRASFRAAPSLTSCFGIGLRQKAARSGTGPGRRICE